MKYVFVCMIFLFVSLNALDIGNWQSIRYSAKLSNNQVLLRSQIEQENLILNKILYDMGTGIAEYDLSLIDPVSATFQASIPVSDSRRYIGLKQAVTDSTVELVPVFHPGAGLPGLTGLSKLSADLANDQSTNYLDIVADYASFADGKLITAIQNRGGGFPYNNAIMTQYYSYMSIIADPAADPDSPDTIVWALNYMNVGLGSISPGLFKITGTGTNDLVRIGNIESQVITGSNLLVMSCNLADLMADPDFAAWYDPANPVFGMQSLSSRTTIFPITTTQTDTSPGGVVYPRALFADPWDYSATGLSNVSLVVEPDDLYFRADYQNQDNLFPISTYFQIEGGASFAMTEDSFDYAQGVSFRSANLSGILGEMDNAEGRVWTGDPSGDQIITSLYIFSYILGIQSPHLVSAVFDGTNIQISWQDVTQTELGNPLTVSRYRVETSDTSDFAVYTVLGVTESTSYGVPVADQGHKRFYRVVAEKDVP